MSMLNSCLNNNIRISNKLRRAEKKAPSVVGFQNILRLIPSITMWTPAVVTPDEGT